MPIVTCMCVCIYMHMCICMRLCVHVRFCLSMYMCLVSEHSIFQSYGQLFVCFSCAVASLARLLQDTFSLCSTFISSCFYFPSVCTLTKHTALNWPSAKLVLVLLWAIDRQIWSMWFSLAAMLACTGQVALNAKNVWQNVWRLQLTAAHLGSFIPLSWKITTYKVSDRTTLILRSILYKDVVLGVYCGLGLDAGVCGGTDEGGGGGGRGMVVLANSCCYLEHNVL